MNQLTELSSPVSLSCPACDARQRANTGKDAPNRQAHGAAWADGAHSRAAAQAGKPKRKEAQPTGPRHSGCAQTTKSTREMAMTIMPAKTDADVTVSSGS